MPNEWFYLEGEEQIGPYPGEQLHELIAGNFIKRETLLWTEGMPEWLPAEQIENLFPAKEVAAVTAASPALVTGAPAASVAATHPTPVQVDPGNPYAVQSVGSPQDWNEDSNSRPYPFVSVTKTSHMKYLTFSLFIPLICLVIFFGTSAIIPEESLEPDGSMAGYEWTVFTAIGAICLASLSSVIGSIMAYVILHRAWRILQPSGEASTSPGKAVGFMFIPFFNLYWIFVAYYGFANDWNRIMPKYSDTRSAPRMTSGLFLSYCICILVFWPVAPILLWIVMAEFCKAINFMVARGLKNKSASPGGLQLY